MPTSKEHAAADRCMSILSCQCLDTLATYMLKGQDLRAMLLVGYLLRGLPGVQWGGAQGDKDIIALPVVSCQAKLPSDGLTWLNMQRCLHQAPQLEPAYTPCPHTLSFIWRKVLVAQQLVWSTRLCIPIGSRCENEKWVCTETVDAIEQLDGNTQILKTCPMAGFSGAKATDSKHKCGDLQMAVAELHSSVFQNLKA